MLFVRAESPLEPPALPFAALLPLLLLLPLPLLLPDGGFLLLPNLSEDSLFFVFATRLLLAMAFFFRCSALLCFISRAARR